VTHGSNDFDRTSGLARSVYYFTDSAEFGGAEEALLLLLEHLDREAWRPTLLHHRSAGIEPLVAGARALGVPTRAVAPAPPGAVGARRLPMLIRGLRRASPDVFHAHLPWPLAAKFPLFAALFARVPAVVATVQLFPQFTLDRSTYVQERMIGAGVGRFVAVSHDVAACLVRRLHWPAGKIDVIHNGVPVDRFREPADAQLRAELAPEGAPLIVSAGRLTDQKGMDVLVAAAALIPEARFAVAGEGPERAGLEAAAHALGVGDRIRFLGRRGDVPRLLATSDAFALPSRWEGSSLAVLEAMAAGTPVVSTAIGGTTELVVDGDSGLLVPPGDPHALASALRAVIADPALASKLGSAGRERVLACFTSARTAERVTAVYASLLGDRADDG
jgi:glycosyltransferase involved in cell wall biosynthesis